MHHLTDVLNKLASPESNEKDWQQACFAGSPELDVARWKKSGAVVYNGKVRDLVIRPDRVLMIHSDRLSAFDRFIGYVPYKGVILTHICKFWFESLRDIVPNHYLSTPHDRTLEVEALTPVKVEVVIRGYLAGSIMRAYQTGERLFCGVRLPEGLKPYEKLTAPIITPTTKAAAFEHDENTSAEDLIQNNVCTRSEWDQICTLANKVFQHGQTTFGKMGWILADTKYEFGKDKNGKIKLMDEVHTPDSSRLWSNLNYAENLKNGRPPEMLDKENIRRFLMEKGFSGYGDVPTTPKAEFVNLAKVYLRVLESLTGKPLVFDEVSAQSVSVIQ